MNFCSKVRQLNTRLASTELWGDSKNGHNFGGIFVEPANLVVPEIAKTCAPFGKVVIFSYSETLMRQGGRITSALLDNEFKVENAVFEQDFTLSVEKVCAYIPVLEDARLIIVLDEELIETASYLATLKNIPFICVLKRFRINRLTASVVKIKNGEKTDCFTANAKRYIVFDGENIFESDDFIVETYSYSASKLLSLMDYRIRLAITGERPNKKAYDCARSALLKIFPLLDKLSENKISIIENLLTLELADSCSGDTLLSQSASAIASSIYCCGEPISSVVELLCALIISEAYGLTINSIGQPITMPPDYGERAEFISDKMGIPENQVLSGYKKQINLLVARKNKLSSLFEKLKAEISSVENTLKKAFDKVKELQDFNSIDTDLLAKATLCSGDLPNSINGMTVARERGFIK